MPEVINKSGRTVALLGWKVLPDSRVVSPRGELKEGLPSDIAYSDQAKHLADQGLITIQGYAPVRGPKAETASEPVALDATTPEVDDLTELANIGASRVKKLRGMGVHTFQDLIDFGAEAMSDLLQIEAAVAESIVEEAVSKFGVGE